jgi:hypothetical protein
MIQTRKMRWERHAACTGEKRNSYRVCGGKAIGKETTRQDLDIGGSIILRWILEKPYGAVWNGVIWLRRGSSGRLL